MDDLKRKCNGDVRIYKYRHLLTGRGCDLNVLCLTILSVWQLHLGFEARRGHNRISTQKLKVDLIFQRNLRRGALPL